jgi:hypothetical protein
MAGRKKSRRRIQEEEWGEKEHGKEEWYEEKEVWYAEEEWDGEEDPEGEDTGSWSRGDWSKDRRGN